mmetsp:Transcript_60544/g.110387  ORF Transcript_60544/g.110387 Transcript_60544/m.110387 type:complete len:202 (+) Transcript_60544:2-607(+)
MKGDGVDMLDVYYFREDRGRHQASFAPIPRAASNMSRGSSVLATPLFRQNISTLWSGSLPSTNRTPPPLPSTPSTSGHAADNVRQVALFSDRHDDSTAFLTGSSWNALTIKRVSRRACPLYFQRQYVTPGPRQPCSLSHSQAGQKSPRNLSVGSYMDSGITCICNSSRFISSLVSVALTVDPASLTYHLINSCAGDMMVPS